LIFRAFFSAIAFIVLTLLGSVLAIPSGIIDRSGDLVLTLARLWARGVMLSAGVRVVAVERAPLDRKRPYVFMANHVSMVDIWALLVAVPVPLRFIAKKQLAAIPLFGWAMRAGRFIFIDRQNASAARRSIDEAARRIKEGRSVVIFPEGTRSREGQLLPFKKGGFHLAVNAGVEIVPVAIHGSRALMPPGTLMIRAGEVTVELGEPVSTAGVSNGDRDLLVERVRDRVAAMLGERSGEQSVNHPQ
jgi:1-acyl-sn-glycerol-3-phosphate acyltransferase